MGLDRDNPRAPYRQVADSLRAAIAGGELAPGDQLDTVAELATKYGVAKMTVQRAINELRDEGLVVSWQGRGTFVRDRGGAAGTAPAAGSFDVIMERLDSMYDELRQVEQRVADLEAARQPATSRARKRGS